MFARDPSSRSLGYLGVTLRHPIATHLLEADVVSAAVSLTLK